jgi:hypothetical protein
MKTTKKPGRPRKAAPVNAVIMKSKTEIALEHANIKIQGLEEDVTELEYRLNESYLQQEKLFKELDKLVYLTIHHCSQVECDSGKLTMHDIDYCVDLIKRILKNKFEYKPKMQEL